MSDRDSKGKFVKGNKPKNKLAPEVKSIREAVKSEVARVTNLLTLPRSEAMAIFESDNSSLLHEIMFEAIEKKKFYIIQDFMDRTCGKAPQAIQMGVSQMSDEDLIELAKAALTELEGME